MELAVNGIALRFLIRILITQINVKKMFENEFDSQFEDYSEINQNEKKLQR